MPTNFFTAGLEQSRSIPAIQQRGLFTDSQRIMRFPTTIGDTDSHLPFAIFAPYTRETTIYSGRSMVLDDLPTPQTAIVLPLPSSALKTSYGVTYEAFDIGGGEGSGVGSALQRLGQIKKVVDTTNMDAGAMSGVRDAFAKIGQQVVDEGASQLRLGALGALGTLFENYENLANIYMGIQQNPFTEVIFKNVNLRSHRFEYSFVPRSRADSDAVDRIIQMFKFFTLPSFRANDNAFVNLPNEWQITYSVADTTFTLLPSVLEDVSVDYSGATDVPTFFRPQDDAQRRYPTKIMLSLQFKEVMILTRNRIALDQQTLRAIPSDPSFIPSSDGARFTRYRF